MTWQADDDQQKRRQSVSDHLDWRLTELTCQLDPVVAPWPRQNWTVEPVPEGEDEDLAPLIYIHTATGQRFLVEVQVDVRSLPTREWELATEAREAELAAGQTELPDG